jgi:hypothetical protein
MTQETYRASTGAVELYRPLLLQKKTVARLREKKVTGLREKEARTHCDADRGGDEPHDCHEQSPDNTRQRRQPSDQDAERDVQKGFRPGVAVSHSSQYVIVRPRSPHQARVR